VREVAGRLQRAGCPRIETGEILHVGGERVPGDADDEYRLFVRDDPGAGDDSFRRHGGDDVEGTSGISD